MVVSSGLVDFGSNNLTQFLVFLSVQPVFDWFSFGLVRFLPNFGVLNLLVPLIFSKFASKILLLYKVDYLMASYSTRMHDNGIGSSSTIVTKDNLEFMI